MSVLPSLQETGKRLQNHNSDTILFAIYPQYGNFIYDP